MVIFEDMKRSIVLLFFLFGCLLVSAQDRRPFIEKGYAGEVEVGVLAKNYSYAEIATTQGYSFGQGWFIGLGASFETGFKTRDNEPGIVSLPDGGKSYTIVFPYEGDRMMRLYLDVRKTFDLGGTDAYVDVKLGSPYNLEGRTHLRRDWGESVRVSAGVVFIGHLAVSAGIDWSRVSYVSSPLSDALVTRQRQQTLPYIGVSYRF